MKTNSQIKTRDVAGIFLTCPSPSDDGYMVAVVEGYPNKKTNEITVSLPKGGHDTIIVDGVAVLETGPQAAVRETAEETSQNITEAQLLRDELGRLVCIYYERDSNKQKKDLGEVTVKHCVTIYFAYTDFPHVLMPDESAHDINKAYWVRIEDLEKTLTHVAAKDAIREIVASLIWNNDDMNLLEQASGSFDRSALSSDHKKQK